MCAILASIKFHIKIWFISSTAISKFSIAKIQTISRPWKMRFNDKTLVTFKIKLLLYCKVKHLQERFTIIRFRYFCDYTMFHFKVFLILRIWIQFKKYPWFWSRHIRTSWQINKQDTMSALLWNPAIEGIIFTVSYS